MTLRFSHKQFVNVNARQDHGYWPLGVVLLIALSAQVTVCEKNGASWHQTTVPAPEFGGKLGIPRDYAWESGGIKLDLAIVVGIYRQ